MLTSLKMMLKGDDADYRQSSYLQGALLERLDSNYVDYLHAQEFHPYSQGVYKTPQGICWQVNTLSREAKENIIDPWLEGPQHISLRRTGTEFKITATELSNITIDSLWEDFYKLKANNSFKLNFLTPTAFRQRKRYVILPDIRLICQNLMLKFSAACPKVNLLDAEALEQIVAHTLIMRHRLRSEIFPLENTHVPGFIGQVGLKCHGPETMAGLLRLLFTFAEYSGVGVRCSMGMGLVKFIREG